MTVSAGTFSSTGTSAGVLVSKGFNVTLSGAFSATIQPERSFDSGATWVPFTFADGSALTWTGPVSTALEEAEQGVLWRLSCTSFGNGPVSWRISQ